MILIQIVWNWTKWLCNFHLINSCTELIQVVRTPFIKSSLIRLVSIVPSVICFHDSSILFHLGLESFVIHCDQWGFYSNISKWHFGRAIKHTVKVSCFIAKQHNCAQLDDSSEFSLETCHPLFILLLAFLWLNTCALFSLYFLIYLSETPHCTFSKDMTV